MPARSPERHAEIVARLREAAAEDRAADAAKKATARRLKAAIAAASRAGFTHREIGPLVGLSHQRVHQLAPPSRRRARGGAR